MLKKYRHIALYAAVGALTTLVNWIVYFLGRKQFSVTVSNMLAWLISVGFAYVTNKTFVFQSRGWSREMLFPELCRFVLCRVGSLLVETGMLWLLVSVLSWQEAPVKILVGFVVTAFNYAASKFLAFRKR